MCLEAVSCEFPAITGFGNPPCRRLWKSLNRVQLTQYREAPTATWQDEKRYHYYKTFGLHHPEVTLTVSIDGEEHELELRLNEELVPSTHTLSYQQDGETKVHSPGKEELDLCQYSGRVRGKPGAWAAVSTCHGVRGVIYDGRQMRYIEPAEDDGVNGDHFLYSHEKLSKTHRCGNEGTTYNSSSESKYQQQKDEPAKVKRHKRHISEDTLVQAPYNANSDTRYVELVLVVDNQAFRASGSDLRRVHHHMKDLANIINSVYSPLNIFIALVGVEVWSDYDKIAISENSEVTLSDFARYRETVLVTRIPNDNAHLLTQQKFLSSVVGKALVGVMCSNKASAGIASNHSPVVGLVAMTIAHEMGHNFGMDHDREEPDCKCPGRKCIMSPVSSSVTPLHWSSCSLKSLSLSFEKGLDYCLRNKPKRLLGSPTCGNGFLEEGEQCDCGTAPGELAPRAGDRGACQRCCAPDCTLRANATCGHGQCCDLTVTIDSNKPKRLLGSPTCGNGFLEEGEQCDCGTAPGELAPRAGDRGACQRCCAPDCTLRANATCGHGQCCDLTVTIDSNKPKRLLGSPTCGNGFLEEGEQCDCGTAPGELAPRAGDRGACQRCCAPDCTLRANATCGHGQCCDLTVTIDSNKPKRLLGSPTCGNGFLEEGEQCDCGTAPGELAPRAGDRGACQRCCAPDCTLRANATCGHGQCCDLTVTIDSNKPKRLLGSPTCGNGFLEEGEQCDCGTAPGELAPRAGDRGACQRCCAPDCTLRANATCGHGQCCDLTTCHYKPAATECRPAQRECDLPEFCTGDSQFCPQDLHKMDTTPCENKKAYCVRGSCQSHEGQCRLLWGVTGSNADDICYKENTKGNFNGNCGYNRSGFLQPCAPQDVKCGMLQCRHYNDRLEYGLESAIVGSSYPIYNGTLINPCRTVVTGLAAGGADPGMVPDGAKCGHDKMCMNQKCKSVKRVRAKMAREGTVCPSNCSGHGVCNSNGNCHCEAGYAPPLCDLPGPGGSIDSGPATDISGLKIFMIVMYVIFLGIIPAIMLALLVIYCFCPSVLSRWKKQQLFRKTNKINGFRSKFTLPNFTTFGKLLGKNNTNKEIHDFKSSNLSVASKLIVDDTPPCKNISSLESISVVDVNVPNVIRPIANKAATAVASTQHNAYINNKKNVKETIRLNRKINKEDIVIVPNYNNHAAVHNAVTNNFNVGVKPKVDITRNKLESSNSAPKFINTPNEVNRSKIEVLKNNTESRTSGEKSVRSPLLKPKPNVRSNPYANSKPSIILKPSHKPKLNIVGENKLKPEITNTSTTTNDLINQRSKLRKVTGKDITK